MLRKINKATLIIALLVMCGIILMGVGYLVRSPIKGAINGYRAERLYEQAGAAFAAENWLQASTKGTAAYYLNPGNRDVELLVARALLKQRQGALIEWWKRALSHPDLPLDELRELTGLMLDGNRLNDGLLFLNRLVELDGMNPETQTLWFKALNLQARFSSSLTLAADLVERGTTDWDIHRQYLRMQEALAGAEGEALALEHLLGLVREDSALSLYAARELIRRRSAPVAAQLQAADYLMGKGETKIDRLYAIEVRVRQGLEAEASLDAALSQVLENPADQELAGLASWAIWAGHPERLIKQVDWQSFSENGNEPDLYLRAMIEAGMYRELIALSEQLGSAEGGDSPGFLYHRALAWENLGDSQQAQQVLTLATQVVDPAETETLELYLMRDERLDFLLRLYQRQLEENPGDLRLLHRLIFVHYSLGDQDELEELISRLDLTDFQHVPAVLAFSLYLKLILEEDSGAIHREVETSLARFPEIYEFRLVLGVSYFLQGEQALASRFAEQLPEIGLGAPRYIRVCAMLLDAQQDLLAPGEGEHLLPRERLLLSRVSRLANH